MSYFKLFCGVIAMVGMVNLAKAENVKVKTPRGEEIEVIFNFPTISSGKLPLIIIAPGQGYHMNLPLVKGLADAAVKNGFASVQFNWAYYSRDPVNGMPSDDRSNEIQDMKAALEFAKKDNRIDTDKIIIAGKSLGSRVSYAVFESDPSLAGLILMTPICTQNKTPVGDKAYPKFAQQTRPISIILGNKDGACELPMLYDFVKSNLGNVAINVFGGGHSLTFGNAGDPANAEKDAKNIEAAISVAALWSQLIILK